MLSSCLWWGHWIFISTGCLLTIAFQGFEVNLVEVTQLPRYAWLAQLPQRICLDPAYTFTRDPMDSTYFIECADLIAYYLIACSHDTPRVVDDTDVFAVQEKVVEDILLSVQEQQAVEAAAKILDPLQQTVIASLRKYLNSPLI